MSSEYGIPFIARARPTGSKKSSLILTIDKDVVDLLDLKPNDILEVRVKKARQVVKD